MAVWVVRSGERNRFAKEFVEHGVVAVGWDVIDGSWASLSSRDILDAFLDAGADPDHAEGYLEEILDFRDRMAEGDTVVVNDPPNVAVGEVTGPDRHLDPSPIEGYHQVRTVRWLGTWPRAQLSDDMKTELAQRSTVTRQRGLAEEWLDIGRRLRAGQAPPAPAPRQRASAPSRPKAPAAPKAPRAPRAAKAPAAPKSTGPAMLLCPSCHCRLPATRFAAGADVCTDCDY